MKTNIEHCAIDIFDDVSVEKTLVKVASNLTADIIKEEIPTREQRDSLDDYQFALSFITKTASKLNKFPINNRVNTALSNEYFELNHYKLPVDAQKIAAAFIKKACDKFDVDPQISVSTFAEDLPQTNLYVQPVLNEAQGHVKTASAEPQISQHYYALGTKYAMPDSDFVNKAVEYFEKHAKKMCPKDRHEYATNVSKRAKELNTKVASVAITKYAGENYNPELESHLLMRQKLLDEASPYVPALRKLASYKGETNPDTFAKVLHELDKKAGLEKYYDTSISDPFAATFDSGMKKSAYAYKKDNILIEDDKVVKLAQKNYDTLKTYFGHSLADGLKKEGSAAFEALPDDAKDVVARIFSGEIQ